MGVWKYISSDEESFGEDSAFANALPVDPLDSSLQSGAHDRSPN